jgi:hypothetical protein
VVAQRSGAQAGRAITRGKVEPRTHGERQRIAFEKAPFEIRQHVAAAHECRCLRGHLAQPYCLRDQVDRRRNPERKLRTERHRPAVERRVALGRGQAELELDTSRALRARVFRDKRVCGVRRLDQQQRRRDRRKRLPW